MTEPTTPQAKPEKPQILCDIQHAVAVIRANTAHVVCHPDDYERIREYVQRAELPLVQVQADEFRVVKTGQVLVVPPFWAMMP